MEGRDKLGAEFGDHENYPGGQFDEVINMEDLRVAARTKEKHKVHMRREIELRSERLRLRDELGLDSWA